MRVKWTEYNAVLVGLAADVFYEPEPEELELHYRGEVIGTHKTWFSGIKLFVMCDDGVVREVAAKKVKPE